MNQTHTFPTLATDESARLEAYTKAKYNIEAFSAATGLSLCDAAAWLSQPLIRAALKAFDQLRIDTLLRAADDARILCIETLTKCVNDVVDPAERRRAAALLLRVALRPLGTRTSPADDDRALDAAASNRPTPAVTPNPSRPAKVLLTAVANALTQNDKPDPGSGLSVLAANLAPGATADGELIPNPDNTPTDQGTAFSDLAEFAEASTPLEAAIHCESCFADETRIEGDDHASMVLTLKVQSESGKQHTSYLKLHARRQKQGQFESCWLITQLDTHFPQRY
jgi:hypothetical protein